MLSCLALILHGLFELGKALIADNVFNPAGVGLRSPGVNACGDKLLGKETMALVDFFGNLAAHIGQMEKACAGPHLRSVPYRVSFGEQGWFPDSPPRTHEVSLRPPFTVSASPRLVRGFG